MATTLGMLSDRRTHQRLPDPPLSCRIRPGHDAVVIDLSGGGALLETDRRLLPGAAIDLQWECGGARETTRARVIRACVCRVAATAVGYRAAIQFTHEVPSLSVESVRRAAHARAVDTQAASGPDGPNP